MSEKLSWKIYGRMNKYVVKYSKYFLVLFIVAVAMALFWTKPLRGHVHLVPVNWINREAVSSEKPNTNAIIVLAYLRSGSTFTASILANHTGVFYTFEPLTGHDPFHENKSPVFHYVNGETRVAQLQNRSRESIHVLESLLSCSWTSLDTATIRNRHMAISESTKGLLECLSPTKNVTLFTMKDCLTQIQKSCRNMPARVLKTIRLSMKDAVMMLLRNPNLKVVHLVRDPRGSLSSRTRVGLKDHTTIGSISQLCQDISENHWVSQAFSREHPGRILEIRYEDLARYPFQITKELFKFLNFDYGAKTEAYLKDITGNANRSKNCFLCTKKKNSSTEAFKWRLTIDHNLARTVDELCVDAYRSFGYVSLKKNELKNLDFPSIKP